MDDLMIKASTSEKQKSDDSSPSPRPPVSPSLAWKRESSEQLADCRVFTASLRAGGLGIDLTSASVVIHYDRWWNQAREDQATDRVHRLGQNKGVQVLKLITRGSVEEKIDALIQRKAQLAEDVISTDDPSLVKQFTVEELNNAGYAFESPFQRIAVCIDVAMFALFGYGKSFLMRFLFACCSDKEVTDFGCDGIGGQVFRAVTVIDAFSSKPGLFHAGPLRPA